MPPQEKHTYEKVHLNTLPTRIHTPRWNFRAYQKSVPGPGPGQDQVQDQVQDLVQDLVQGKAHDIFEENHGIGSEMGSYGSIWTHLKTGQSHLAQDYF